MKKRILIISPYNPFTPTLGAASKTLRYRIENLATNANVTLLTFSGSSEYEKKIAKEVNVETFFIDRPPRTEGSRYKFIRFTRIVFAKLIIFANIDSLVSNLIPYAMRLTNEKSFDLIQIEDVVIAPIVKHLPRNVSKIIFFHNLLTLQYENVYKTKRHIPNKILSYVEYFWIKRFEKKLIKEFDVAVVLTEIERQRAQSISPNTHIVQIPLEIDPKEYAPKDIPTEFPSVAFSGTMSYYPNHEAVIYFTKYIFPMILDKFPNTKFYVVGKNPGHKIMRLRSDNVIVTGEVKTIQEFLLKSNVVVVPLLNGGGMRLKILEAFSLSKAVVSTLLGAEGIEYTDGKDILIADDPKIFADKVCCLLENVEKAKELGINARELVEKEYSVNAVWEKWKDLYERLIW